MADAMEMKKKEREYDMLHMLLFVLFLLLFKCYDKIKRKQNKKYNCCDYRYWSTKMAIYSYYIDGD